MCPKARRLTALGEGGGVSTLLPVLVAWGLALGQVVAVATLLGAWT